MLKFDSVARHELVEHLDGLGGVSPQGPRPVVSLEKFFHGNNDDASLGENLAEHPGIDAFEAILKEIRSLPDVDELVVEVRLVDGNSWPFAKGVYVVTGAERGKVAGWFAPLRPTSITVGYGESVPPGLTQPRSESLVFGIWWD